MIFDTLFILELLLVAVLVTMILGGAIYLAARNRRIRREPGRHVETAGGAEGGAATDESDNGSAERAAPPRREFYKGTGLERGDENIKLRLYSFAEYQNELGGIAAQDDFLAAMKAYR
jgi:hypothetical protein